MSVPDRKTQTYGSWQRDLKMEARGKRNFLYRAGFLGGVLFSWAVVGTGYVSFLYLSVAAAVVPFVTTMWDFWKMWKGK